MPHWLTTVIATCGVLIAVVATISGGWALWRGGGGTALDTLERANRVLEQRVHELERLRADDQATIAALSAKTDVSLALHPILELTTRHEVNAQARADAVLRVLDLIAKRLGPDSDIGG